MRAWRHRWALVSSSPRARDRLDPSMGPNPWAQSIGYECLRQVGDEIVGVFNSNGQTNGGIAHANARAHFARHTRVSGRARMACKRFCTTETDCQLEDLQPVEAVERLRQSALHVKRKRRSWCGTLTLIHTALRSICRQERQIIDLFDSRMVTNELGHGSSIAICTLHAKRQRLERSANHPGRVGVELGADGPSKQPDRLHQGFAAERCSSDEIRVPADVLGEGID